MSTWLCYLAVSDVISIAHLDDDACLDFPGILNTAFKRAASNRAVMSCPIESQGGDLPSAVLYTD
jgi:hypothetical protein